MRFISLLLGCIAALTGYENGGLPGILTAAVVYLGLATGVGVGIGGIGADPLTTRMGLIQRAYALVLIPVVLAAGMIGGWRWGWLPVLGAYVAYLAIGLGTALCCSWIVNTFGSSPN